MGEAGEGRRAKGLGRDMEGNEGSAFDVEGAVGRAKGLRGGRAGRGYGGGRGGSREKDLQGLWRLMDRNL